MVKLAAEGGADAIKFQIVDPDRLVADKKQLFTYNVLVDSQSGRTEKVSEPLYDILCRRALNREQWIDLKQFSDENGLAFFATIAFEDEIELVESLGCASIKIASGDVNHWPLIRKAARTGLCLQVDTGNATVGEIEQAVEVIRKECNENIIIHNCPSGYPARLESINLSLIPSLKRLFPYPVAFSDHTPGWDMDIAAVALGANLVEKTLSEDRATRSVEHLFSLEPQELKLFVGKIRDLETAMGHARRILQPEELEKRKAVRRSAFTRSALTRGSRIEADTVVFRRPGYGIGPDVFESLVGVRARRDLPAGHMLQFGDLD